MKSLRYYVIDNYGQPPQWRWVMLMRTASPFPSPEDGKELPEQYKIHNKYVGQDVIKIHTKSGDMPGNLGDASGYLQSSAFKWEMSNPDTFLESVNDFDNPYFRDHYFNAVLDDDYLSFFYKGDPSEDVSIPSPFDDATVDDIWTFLLRIIDVIYEDPEDAIEAMKNWVGRDVLSDIDADTDLVKVILAFLGKVESLSLQTAASDPAYWYVENRDGVRFFLGDGYVDAYGKRRSVQCLGDGVLSHTKTDDAVGIHVLPAESEAVVTREMMLPPTKYWTDVMGRRMEDFDTENASLQVARHRMERVASLTKCDCDDCGSSGGE